MRIVVQTTEGIFRSDEMNDMGEEALKSILNDFTGPESFNVMSHGNLMCFNPRHIVWVKLEEHYEPF